MSVQDPDEPQGPPEPRNPDGTPTNTNPTVTIADFGAAPIGVPNFVIDQFTIPPFLLPIYQACGTQYGIPWEVLASINRIETAFGTNLNVSSAGALGWMQFIPSSWEAYGVDANNDGRKDPYNPVDAICAAANYLDAAGGQEDLATRDLRLQPRRLVRRRGPPLRAPVRQDPRRPRRLAHRPDRGRPLPRRRQVPLRRRHLRARGARARDAQEGQRRATPPTSSRAPPPSAASTSTAARARPSSPSTTASSSGSASRSASARYIVLEDAYGNRFTYAELGEVAEAYPVPKRRKNPMRDLFVESEEKPDEPASAGKQVKADETRRPQGLEGSFRARQHRGLAHTALRLPRARGQPGPGGPHRPARRPPEPPDARVRGRQVLLLERPALRRRQDGPRAAREGLEGRRRHDPRPRRQDERARPPPPLRDPPDGPRRTQDRPEADPRRLEAPRGNRDLPRGGQEPVRRHRRHDRPGPAHVEGAADQAGPRQQPARALLLRSRLRPRRPDRPARPRRHGIPDGARLSPDDHVDALRAREQHHDLGQRLQPLVRRCHRHRPDQRHPSPWQPGPGHGRRSARAGHARAPGHDGARRGDLADELRRPHRSRCATTTTTCISATGPPQARPRHSTSSSSSSSSPTSGSA